MTDKEFKDINISVRHNVLRGRLHDAFSSLRLLSERLMAWETTSAINAIEESYKFMLDYAAKGVDDPGRAEIYDSIKSDILSITDRLSRGWLRRESPSLYFNTLRFEATRKDESISRLLARYSALEGKSSMFNMVADSGNAADTATDVQAEKEALEKRLFDRVWVSFPMHRESVEALADVVATDLHSKDLRYMVLCAIILGELQYHDEERLLLLIDAYTTATDNYLSMVALTGLMLGLFLHADRHLSTRLSQRLDAAAETPTWAADMRAVFLELIRTRDTERITRKLRDEVIPQMLRLRPDMSKKFKAEGGINLENLEENPEWQELLEKSGVTERLKELSDLQEEGADVFMGAFSQLKSFPFFNDIVNWFRLFSPAHSALNKDRNKSFTPIFDMLSLSPMLCDSDKYSFALSVVSMPDSQRAMMASQLEAQSAQMAEMSLASVATANIERRKAAKIFIQNLYRFFKLFRRKGEFCDPFDDSFTPCGVTALENVICDADTLGLVGEFYFKRGYWDEARDIFSILVDFIPPSALIFQKLGYCYQKDGEIDSALEYYLQAELLNAENHWTLRRIATCYRLLGDLEKALEYYEKIEKFYPEDVSLAMNVGHTLLEAGRLREAVDRYYKADYLDPASPRAWRPLAWSLFLTKDFAASHRYYDKVMTDAPTPEDYLNMGHLALAEKNIKEALNFYNLFIQIGSGGTEALVRALSTDRPSLAIAGVDPAMIPLIIDLILYSTK